jgi:hypothetical protein
LDCLFRTGRSLEREGPCSREVIITRLTRQSFWKRALASGNVVFDVVLDVVLIISRHLGPNWPKRTFLGVPLDNSFGHGFPIVFAWFSVGFHIAFVWCSYGSLVVFRWFPNGFLIVCQLFSHCFLMIFARSCIR